MQTEGYKKVNVSYKFAHMVLHFVCNTKSIEWIESLHVHDTEMNSTNNPVSHYTRSPTVRHKISTIRQQNTYIPNM